MALTYISWAPHCSRSDCTARELGGVSHMVYWGQLGSHPATVWLKYIGQTVRTWKILASEKPDAVFVMSPPVVAVVAVYLYCAVRRVPFVVDAHTGAFLNPRWRHFQKLQFWLCRRAATTIVTNDHLASLVTARGGDITLLPDVPVTYPEGGRLERPTGTTIAVVASFDHDEPVPVVFAAARQLPDVTFLVTGNRRNAEKLGLEFPANVMSTGFLSDEDYGSLIRGADAVMALTKGKHTMLRAAYEAIYQGTPVIISDSPLLRQEFPAGAVFVEHVPEQIAGAVRTVQRERERYRTEARELRAQKQQRWERNKALLRAKLSETAAAP
jgi:glycosyltransferase involved in cell wall biosynthesis